MRIFITDKETDLEALATSLARTPRASAATLARVKALNPQLADATRVPKGGVVVLPEGPDIKPDAGTTVSHVPIDELAGNFTSGTRAQASRAAQRLESLTAERSAVRDALKTVAAKRLIDNDPLLQKQLAAADAQFKAEQKRATESRAELARRIKAAQEEMERMMKEVT